MKRAAMLLPLFALLCLPLAAQATDDEIFGGGDEAASPADSGTASSGTAAGVPGAAGASDDELFSDGMVKEAAPPAAGSPLVAVDALSIGGSFAGSLDLSGTFDLDALDLMSPAARSFRTGIGTKLYVDARPDDAFRVYAKFALDYPYSVVVDPADPAAANAAVPTLRVFELFSDFQYGDSLFFRFGKQVVKWGVGYFFSPADSLSLTGIDPTDPEAEREGPVALSVHYPIPRTQHNIWLYLISKDPSILPENVGVALKAQFLFNPVEITLGGFYMAGVAPRAMLMGVLPTGNFQFFGEAVLSYGVDRPLFEASSDPGNTLGVLVEKPADGLFLNATLGFMYMDMDASATIAAQYLFQGDGYLDPALLGKAMLVMMGNPSLLLPPQSSALSPYHSMPLLGVQDLVMRGAHYAALSFSQGKLFGAEDLSFSVFIIANLVDLSGRIMPSFSYKLFDHFTAKLGATFVFGDDGDEATLAGPGMPARSMTIDIGLSVGGGKF